MKKILTGLILLTAFARAFAQQAYLELTPIPEAVTNNAVAAAIVNDTPYVYSFCGLDSTRKWSGIHLKAWRMNLLTQEWQSLPPVPDPAGGKIAAAASLVKGLIYIVGGYHVDANGNESSSSRVHRFDPATNAWLPDAAPLIKAIDDHVQAVWRDSLLFVVTGWSNTQNVPTVQIYNPATDTWQSGTTLPNNNNFKAFGASGVIIGDTLYYCGGAGAGANFAATSVLRKGYIHPDDPTQITWTSQALAQAKGYRMAAAAVAGHPIWLGGSDKTYNYDGIAYDGSGVVSATTRIKEYDRQSGILTEINDPALFPALMDLRGVAQITADQFVTVGGMGMNQQVLHGVFRFNWAYTVASHPAPAGREIMLHPNPADQSLEVECPGGISICLRNLQGSTVLQQAGFDQIRISTASIPAGLYFMKITPADHHPLVKSIVIAHY